MRRVIGSGVCLALTLSLVGGCADGNPGASNTADDNVASAPTFARAPALSKPAAAKPMVKRTAHAPAGSGNLDENLDGPADEAGDDSAEEPTAADTKPSIDVSHIKVANIGMHIGGGPNDEKTKKPIRGAVQPHYAALSGCYVKLEKLPKKATYGVDIRIGREGGKAKISNPRAGYKGSEVAACMLDIFEGIDFPRPPKGMPQMVSFSLRFTKK